MNNNTNNISSAKSASAKFFTFDHLKKTIRGSEVNFKKAGNPTNPQYDELMAFMAAHPTYRLVPTTSKKQTYEGLTRDLMLAYISIQKNNEEVMAQYEQMKKDNIAYPTVKSWFLDTYKGFNVKKAKRTIREHTLESTKEKVILRVKAAAKVAPATAELPQAANF